MADAKLPRSPRRAKDPRPWLGRRYGRWLVLGDRTTGAPVPRILCRCDCGVERMVIAMGLRSGSSTSCGCWNREYKRVGPVKHGHSRSATYNSWSAMNQRCANPKTIGYANYGGRGIAVCPEWAASFEAFLADVGPRPSRRHTLDRIDGDGDYRPGNVRWALARDQCRNKTNNRLVDYQGRKVCLKELAEIVGLKYSTLHARLRRGWSMGRALDCRP